MERHPTCMESILLGDLDENDGLSHRHPIRTPPLPQARLALLSVTPCTRSYASNPYYLFALSLVLFRVCSGQGQSLRCGRWETEMEGRVVMDLL